MEIKKEIIEVKNNCKILASVTDDKRNEILFNFAVNLKLNKDKILKANELDISLNSDLNPSLVQRLKMNEEKLESAIEGIYSVIKQVSPVNRVISKNLLDDSLVLEKVSFPLGLIAMIYEARPEAGIQMISLAIKSGNGLILKGGKEARNTNTAIFEVFKKSMDLPLCIALLHTHEDISEMLRLDEYIDLLIPRGSNKLVSYCLANSKIPVLGHADGICHIFVDESADLTMAKDICLDSKIQYPAACNAVETILVHEKIAAKFLPIFKSSCDENNVIINGCCNTLKYIDVNEVSSYDIEFSDLEVNIKIVNSINEAIDHIEAHSSRHTDCIITSDINNKSLFFSLVDSADVFHNCSTRFADGYRFALGAEVGISTSKIHARGPVGLEGLTTTKYLLSGKGHIVSSYSGKNAKKFIHKDIL